MVKDLLEEMVCNTTLCPAEHKAAASILRVLTKEEEVVKAKVDLNVLLTPPQVYILITLSAYISKLQLVYYGYLPKKKKLSRRSNRSQYLAHITSDIYAYIFYLLI